MVLILSKTQAMDKIVLFLQEAFVCLLGMIYGEMVFRVVSVLSLKFVYTIKFLFLLLVILFAIPAITVVFIRTIALRWLIIFYLSSNLYLWYRVASTFNLYYGG